MDSERNMFARVDKRSSAVDLVVNHIKELLLNGELKPGDRLPNELELSEYMGVSRGSVREAMKILSAFGLVEVKVGNGTFVCDRPGNSLLDNLLFSFYITNPDMSAMYEFRQMFEIDIMQLILKHRDENASIRKEMHENLDLLAKDIAGNADSDTLLNDDLAFHRLMGKASCNVLMEQIYNFIMEATSASIKDGIKQQRGEYIYANHRDILQVIDSNDFTEIDRVITNSLNDWTSLQDSYANSSKGIISADDKKEDKNPTDS